MKNPKSNYIGEARRIMRTRLIIRGIVAGSVLLIVGFVIFFSYILKLKKNIDTEFPSEPSSESVSVVPSSDSSSDTGESTEPGDTTLPPDTSDSVDTTPDDTTPDSTGPDDTTGEDPTADPTGDPTGDPTAETTISLLPDDWDDREPVLFPSKYPLQTVTHAERDQAYTNLKHNVKKYIEDHPEARISFCYINLSTSEYFGYNDVQPFVVGSCINLPIVMMMYDDVQAGLISLQTAMAYNSSYAVPGTTSPIAEGPEGKQFFLDQLAYLALRDGDSAAMNMLLERMGGSEEVLARLKTMTLCIDYSAIKNYVDYKGVQQSGAGRSSAYDLAHYAEMLYWRYMAYPDTYQDLINALAESTSPWGVGKYFPTGTLVLHRTGSNINYNSEADVAIILSSEPIVISVVVEADTPEAAQDIQAALGALVYNFISYCHA